MGFRTYDLLTSDRNRGIRDPARQIPPGRFISPPRASLLPPEEGGPYLVSATSQSGEAELVVAIEQRPDYHKNNRKPKVDSVVVHIRLATSLCASISLTPTAPGETEQFTAQALDAGGSVIQDAEMSWRSNSPEVASVSSDGLVSATALGTAVIVASSLGCSESAKVSVIDESVDDGLVTDLMPARYNTVRLQVGDQYYVDRTFTITGLAPGYEDWLWIRTANDGKAATADDFLTFTLLDSAVVAVAYYRRATALPGWLDGWVEAPDGIDISDAGASPLRVFRQTYGPGPVALGGNMAGGAVGAQSMYVVLLLLRSALAPTAVAVKPTAVTLEPGETEAFSATLQDQLGQPMAGEIVWAATGGAITAAGVYTAGATEGTYEVAATEQGTGLVGTAQVTIEAPASGTGDLEVTTATTGTDPDPDGYTVTVDGSTSQPLTAGGTVTFSALSVGDHTVQLSDLAANCTVWGLHPRTVSVTFNGTAITTFAVTCTALLGNLDVSNTTTGTDPDADYTVTIDAGTPQALAASGTLALTGLTVGDHTVLLSDVASNCTVLGLNPRTVNVPFNGTSNTSFEVICIRADAPYGPSPVIEDVTWDFANRVTAAPGSDLWPVTWGSNDNIYASWGDGGGFGGTNADGRVSLGFARIEGPPATFNGVNVWGGKNPENIATFPGKSAGILSVGGVLYAWINTQVGNPPDFRLATSSDLSATWQMESWIFSGTDFVPSAILNFGKDYAGARDGFVYFYGGQWAFSQNVYLARVAKDQIKVRARYEFFSGLDVNGNPTWSSDITQRAPVFTDANLVAEFVAAIKASVVHNPAINRYMLTVPHGGPGKLGVFDAPEPWGPWTTVAYYDNWGSFGTAGEGLLYAFPTKWISPNGLTMWLVFSATGVLDAYNQLKATLTLRSP